jgi:hypothetical protein
MEITTKGKDIEAQPVRVAKNDGQVYQRWNIVYVD